MFICNIHGLFSGNIFLNILTLYLDIDPVKLSDFYIKDLTAQQHNKDHKGFECYNFSFLVFTL